jgi:hypothetical protein
MKLPKKRSEIAEGVKMNCRQKRKKLSAQKKLYNKSDCIISSIVMENSIAYVAENF